LLPHLRRPFRRDRWRDGLAPLRFSACARRGGCRIIMTRGLRPAAVRDESSASVRAPVRSGHAPPLRLLGAGVPLPGSSRRATWPADASGTLAAPVAPAGGAPGVLALRGVAPARGCRGVSAAWTHLPFFRRAPRRMAFGFVRRDRSVVTSPIGSEDLRVKCAGRRFGRGSWASSPRAVRAASRRFARRGRCRPGLSPLSGVRTPARVAGPDRLVCNRSQSFRSGRVSGRSWVLRRGSRKWIASEDHADPSATLGLFDA